jgi:hypothetical protein
MGVIGDSSGVIVTVKYQQFGSVSENSFQYYDTDPAGQITPADAAGYFSATVIPLMQAVMATAVQLLQINIQTTAPTGFTPYPTYIQGLVGTNGTVTGDVLSPQAAVRLDKLPDVANQDTPAPPTPWRLGHNFIGGVPESTSTTGGFVGITPLVNYALLATALLTFTAGGETMQMYQRRFTSGSGSPDFFVPILSITPYNAVTTMNSRKYWR